MPAYPQWWDSTKAFQVAADTSSSPAAGSTVAAVEFWLFNDKGGSLGATTMAAPRLILEAWDGKDWRRSGLPILDEGWLQAAVTGIDNTGDAGMPAQSTSYASLGTNRELVLNAIPKNCGRKIGVQIVVPLGASQQAPQVRLVPLDAAAPTYLRTDGSIAESVGGNKTFTGNILLGASGTPQGRLDVRGTFVISNSDASYWKLDRDDSDGALTFVDSATEILRIDGSRNLGLGGNSFGSGQRVMFFGNRVAAPSANPVAGHIVYAESGALKGRGSSGTVTTIAAAEPHCPNCGRDVGVIESVNGAEEYIFVCVPCLIEDLGYWGKPYVMRVEADSKSSKRKPQEIAEARLESAARGRAALEAAKVKLLVEP